MSILKVQALKILITVSAHKPVIKVQFFLLNNFFNY
jgi:hypothetical protein